jgi:hypothetical protein
LGKPNGFQPIPGFADNLDVSCQGEKGAQILPHSFHIIYDHYEDVSHALNIRAEQEKHI